MNIEPDPFCDQPLSREQAVEARARISDLRGVPPALSSASFIWLHQAVFVSIIETAGQIRNLPRQVNGAYFAVPEMILPSLDARFKETAETLGYRGLSQEACYRAIAHHISELYTIQPFVIGNRAVIGLHAEQLARAAGHPFTRYNADRTVWDEAYYHGFIYNQTGPIARALSGISEDDQASDGTRLGPGGIPLLPERDAALGTRYIKKLKAVKRELAEHLGIAREEASDLLTHLVEAGAPPAEIEAAEHERTYLRHANGPMFQADLLIAVGVEAIEGVFHKAQTPAERVREIANALIMEISRQSRSRIEAASRTLRRPFYLPGGSPHQDRLAAEFLRNSATDNLADIRFATAQRSVDAAVAAISLDMGFDPSQLEAITDNAREEAAQRIREGDMSGVLASTTAPVPTTPDQGAARVAEK